MGGKYKDINKRRSYARSYYHKHKKHICSKRKPEVFRNWYLIHNYGITAKEYDELLRLQNNLCAICKRSDNGAKKFFSVDHDHKTGNIRGLLCNNCNLLLGHAKDNPDILQKAIFYLERF